MYVSKRAIPCSRSIELLMEASANRQDLLDTTTVVHAGNLRNRRNYDILYSFMLVVIRVTIEPESRE
jgi:hypothetical protein